MLKNTYRLRTHMVIVQLLAPCDECGNQPRRRHTMMNFTRPDRMIRGLVIAKWDDVITAETESAQSDLPGIGDGLPDMRKMGNQMVAGMLAAHSAALNIFEPSLGQTVIFSGDMAALIPGESPDFRLIDVHAIAAIIESEPVNVVTPEASE